MHDPACAVIPTPSSSRYNHTFSNAGERAWNHCNPKRTFAHSEGHSILVLTGHSVIPLAGSLHFFDGLLTQHTHFSLTSLADSLAAEANPLYTPGKKGTFASTVCLLSSTLMFVLALCGLSWRLFQLVPKSVKEAMPIGLGLMLAMSGFEQMQFVVPTNTNGTGVTMGDITSPTVIFGCVGTVLMVYLHGNHWKTAFLIPIILLTTVAWICSSTGVLTFSPPASPPTAIAALPKAFFIEYVNEHVLCLANTSTYPRMLHAQVALALRLLDYRCFVPILFRRNV